MSSKVFLFILILLLCGCGNATEHEATRKKLLDGLQDHRIKRVTQEQIHSAAYREGQRVIDILEKENRENTFWMTAEGKDFLDSLNRRLDHGGIALLSATTTLTEISAEQLALLEAYQYSSDQGQRPGDNVQTTQGDYLMYTSPVLKDDTLMAMWSIFLSRKTLVQGISQDDYCIEGGSRLKISRYLKQSTV